MKNEKIELGDEVKDIVTGFRGIITAKYIYLNGCIRFSIQPEVDKDGKLPTYETFDEPLLKILEKNKIKYSYIKNHISKIKLGDEIKDKVTGFKGIAVIKLIYLTSSDRFAIQPKIDKDQKFIDSLTFDEDQLEKLEGKYIFEDYKEPGGPEKYMPKSR